MAWQAFTRCSCCQGCAFLDGASCRFHPMRRLCDGHCHDYAPAQIDAASVLTDEERDRCLRLAAHPIARFPLLTLDEMRHLLWYREYFGEREHHAA